jgi:hypothetical protein
MTALKEVCGFRRFDGKFRGVVENNVDPKGEGRILVTVAEIAPTPLLNWAIPCTPVGGPQHGMFAVPPIKSEVWIEFEQGDPDYPIWTGCMWGGGVEVPRQAPLANPIFQSITLQTPGQNSIVISDLPQHLGVEIRVPSLRQRIRMGPQGIEIDNGLGASIKLRGPTIEISALGGVNINSGALVVR